MVGLRGRQELAVACGGGGATVDTPDGGNEPTGGVPPPSGVGPNTSAGVADVGPADPGGGVECTANGGVGQPPDGPSCALAPLLSSATRILVRANALAATATISVIATSVIATIALNSDGISAPHGRKDNSRIKKVKH